MTDNLEKSMELFKRLTSPDRVVCYWRVDDKTTMNFVLECWQMRDGSTRIFQIFRAGNGFIQYVQNDEI